MPIIASGGWGSSAIMNALIEGKFTEVDDIFGCGDQVNELTHFRLKGSFQEELQKVNIAWVGAKMDFE